MSKKSSRLRRLAGVLEERLGHDYSVTYNRVVGSITVQPSNAHLFHIYQDRGGELRIHVIGAGLRRYLPNHLLRDPELSVLIDVIAGGEEADHE
jgi:hypothetical protein